jgi:phytoene desaturase
VKRSIVIGSGFGGLAAAVRLRAKGYDVKVLEALDQPGGRARVFRQDGFTFDAGPTVITAPYLIAELFQLLGRDARDYFELIPVDPFYRIRFHDGESFDYFGDDERLYAEIERLSPRDVDGYRRMADHARRIFDVGYTQLADQPFHNALDMMRVVPAMMKLQSHRTVWSLVSRYIKDERLRQAFTFEPLLVGGNPFSTTSIYLLIHWLERKWGVHYARGGTSAIVHSLVKLLEQHGVEFSFGDPVERITESGGMVRGVSTVGGRSFMANTVVANADPTVVYERMLGRPMRRTMRQSMSLFVGYFGTNREYPDLKHHTILLGPRYRELLTDIFQRKVLAEDFSLYLHAPTRSDPSMAPHGGECFYVLSPVPNMRSGIDWNSVGDAYFDRIIAALNDTVLPGVSESIVTRRMLTPQQFQDDLRSADGAAFGPEPVLWQSAYFRHHNQSSVRGLYFVGAGTHPGGGVPGVLSSAKVVDRLIPAA